MHENIKRKLDVAYSKHSNLQMQDSVFKVYLKLKTKIIFEYKFKTNYQQNINKTQKLSLCFDTILLLIVLCF